MTHFTFGPLIWLIVLRELNKIGTYKIVMNAESIYKKKGFITNSLYIVDS